MRSEQNEEWVGNDVSARSGGHGGAGQWRKPGGRGQVQGAHQKKSIKKGKPAKPKEIETIAVMFVDQTVGGMLAKRLQMAEDAIAEMVGYRVRMVETSGTQLCRLLPNTNP